MTMRVAIFLEFTLSIFGTGLAADCDGEEQKCEKDDDCPSSCVCDENVSPVRVGKACIGKGGRKLFCSAIGHCQSDDDCKRHGGEDCGCKANAHGYKKCMNGAEEEVGRGQMSPAEVFEKDTTPV